VSASCGAQGRAPGPGGAAPTPGPELAGALLEQAGARQDLARMAQEELEETELLGGEADAGTFVISQDIGITPNPHLRLVLGMADRVA